jgi:hypothetical protein
LKPPNETPTSPPACRTVLTIAATCVSDATGAVPSHAGVQPPPESTNAKMKFFSPLPAITSAMLCGLLSSGMKYGAVPLSGLPAATAGWLSQSPPATPSPTSAARAATAGPRIIPRGP